MKILYVATVSGTINAFLIPHIKMLVDHGHKVDIACNIQQELKQEIFDMGCTIHALEFERYPLNKGNFTAYKRLKKIIKEEQYDLVHTHTPIASAFVRLACRKVNNTRVFYTAHGFHFYKGAPLKNWILYYPVEKWLSKYTDCLITMNEEDYETVMKKNFKAKQIASVNGVGIDLGKFLPSDDSKRNIIKKEYNYKEDDFVLIYVGELNNNKNQGLLIETIGRLKREILNIKLLLVGDGLLYAQYKKQIDGLKANENVELLGYRTDIANLMSMADIAVSSSKREGLPLNVMEAMATGLPLVVTNSRGNQDLVINGVNGYVVSCKYVENFAKKILDLYKQKELRDRFGKKSIELVEKYSVESVLGEMKNIYKL